MRALNNFGILKCTRQCFKLPIDFDNSKASHDKSINQKLHKAKNFV